MNLNLIQSDQSVSGWSVCNTLVEFLDNKKIIIRHLFRPIELAAGSSATGEPQLLLQLLLIGIPFNSDAFSIN
jgi:hypothetical protein